MDLGPGTSAGRPPPRRPGTTGRSGPTAPAAAAGAPAAIAARPGSWRRWCGSRRTGRSGCRACRPAEEGELVGPQVRVVLLRDRAGADVALPGRGGREEVLAQRRLVGGPVRPERAAGVPQRAEPVGVRDRVLHDHRPHPGGVRGRQPESDRAAVVLHEQGVAAEAEVLGEPSDDRGQVVEGVGEAGRVGGVAVPETRVVRRDEVEGVTQPGQQRLPHPRGGREAVQQQDRRAVGRARLAVEDRHPVDVGPLIHGVPHELCRVPRGQAA